MSSRIKSQLVLIILISFLVGYYFGVNKVKLDWKNYKPSLTVTNKEPSLYLSSNSVDFSLFWTVWQKLENNYYDKSKLDAKKMLNGAIGGMVQSVGDPYTLYLPPSQNNDFKQGLAGQFSGIGAELGLRDKQIIVIAPITGSPAQKSGIEAGDAIVKVDGEITIGWTLPQAVEKIRGEKGTQVTLTIMHKNSEKEQVIKITRDIITVKSVDGWVKKAKDIKGVSGLDLQEIEVGYIRLSQFGDSTNKDWFSLVNALNLQLKNKNVRGLILDLRNNPGGYLTDAVFISSEFLKKRTPVVIEDNGRQEKMTLSVSRRGLLTDIPLIVLINKGSASASEIVSGALRDNKRAILLGENSFGKGTIQQADDLGNGAGLHITIAKWLTPNSTWVNGVGLKPDISVLATDPKDPSHDLQLEKAVKELIK